MIKKVISLFLVAVIVATLAGCQSGEKSVGLIPIKESTEVLNLLNKKDNQEIQYIYFGRPTCSVCKQFQPKLEKALEKQKEAAFYYDTDSHRTDKDFKKVIEEFDLVELPYLIKIKQGAIVDAMKSDGDIENFVK
ncbi:thioredoxin family protein [Listeria booriae]|uniref:Thioredoxin family protein n=1 Tax=Listeria booriae TaxID=1552123 RepID=A0A7X1CEN8_9LIST|nr:thioredoxin family protein [Listeria booriae]MBC1561555.1 thioredoxin family protein [Listeria booriae]MBC1574016.1 thioredoxin family protein [Listeria booriae]